MNLISSNLYLQSVVNQWISPHKIDHLYHSIILFNGEHNWVFQKYLLWMKLYDEEKLLYFMGMFFLPNKTYRSVLKDVLLYKGSAFMSEDYILHVSLYIIYMNNLYHKTIMLQN